MASKNQNFACFIGALGLIKKDTDKFLEKIPGNPRLEGVQKIVLNGFKQHSAYSGKSPVDLKCFCVRKLT